MYEENAMPEMKAHTEYLTFKTRERYEMVVLDIELGKQAVSEGEILRRVEDELASEIKIMLDEGVVAAAEDIDLCLILGAGWPFQAGGATPYLDRSGASERAFGASFHTPRIAGSR